MADRRVAAIRRWALWSCVPRSARFALEASSSQPLGPRGFHQRPRRKGCTTHVPIVHFTFPCTMDSPGIRNDWKIVLTTLPRGRPWISTVRKPEDVSVFAFQRDRLIVAIIYARAALMLYEIGVTVARVDLLRSSYRSFPSYVQSCFNNPACRFFLSRAIHVSKRSNSLCISLNICCEIRGSSWTFSFYYWRIENSKNRIRIGSFRGR